MERLTIRNSDGSVSQPTKTTIEAAFYRLAEYEDTGLTPDEITAMEIVVLERKMADIESVNGVPIERVIQLVEEEIARQPNDPLTLEDLRQMLGEPVWIEANWESGSWAILCWINSAAVGAYKYGLPKHALPDRDRVGMIRSYRAGGCGETWRAYRRKPEEGTA